MPTTKITSPDDTALAKLCAVLAEGALETVQADPRVIEVYLGR